MVDRIVRVFPRHTSYTPTDPLVFVGDPPLALWRPEADEVHVSVTFTWDVEEGYRLAEAWGQYYSIVKVGGPALGSECNEFAPGLYVKPGVTFTTRGCDNQCPWCLVPKREENLREIEDFALGHIVQDNNLLQASRPHLSRVFSMLRSQSRATVFSGGLDARLLDDWVAEQLRELRINSVFLAADTEMALGPLAEALRRLSFLRHWQRRVYCLIGFGGETLEQAERRLERIWELGGVPFAQLYQPADRWIAYLRDWRILARTWSRPAAMAAAHGGWQGGSNDDQNCDRTGLGFARPNGDSKDLRWWPVSWLDQGNGHACLDDIG